MYAVRRLSLITKFHHLDVEAGEWQGRTRAVDAHGPIGEARVTATWNARSFGVVGGLKARQDHQCSTPANRARSHWARIICVAVVGRSPSAPLASCEVISCTVAATVRSSAEPTAAAARVWRSDGGAVSNTCRNSSFMPG